ncbi:MAG: LuxR C-terminal-related transcriptional regulator [Candidatus Dormibacteraeota bacterium]|nr:LuxR C-terminal-related transcriptional regulator [Candidatus Dormibacteraeota bacterium]
MSASFVGRRVELAVLESVCSNAESGSRPAAALIFGLPGSGKTRLLAELRSRQRATQLSLAGYEAGTRVPLAAAGDLLRALGNDSGAGGLLSELLSATGLAVDRSLEPLRLFEAARRALLGVEGPILLIVDDLQWVDELSLALCSYLVRSAETEQKGLALIAASRPAGGGAAFHDSLIKELGSDRVTEVELGPLEQNEGVQLIRQLAPQLSVQRATELWKQSKGSAFWLAILARNDGDYDLAGYIGMRQRELGRDAGRLLALLAVATRPLAVSELEAIMAWDQSRTDEAVAELDRAGLTVTQGIAVDLAHDLIRTSAMAQLSGVLQRELHAQLATWLERQAGADVQVLHEALVHRRAAGLDVNELALRVLQSPRRRLLGREALQELARIADANGFSEPLRIALQLTVAELASELGEHQIALDRWTPLASSVSDRTLRAAAYLAASRAALRMIDRRDDAVPLVDLARDQAPDDPVLAIEIESHRANLLQLLKHRGEEGRAAAFHAAEKARQLWANPATEITSRERDAYVAALQGAFDSAVVEEDAAAQLRIAEEMTQLARGSEEGAIWAAHNNAAALMFVGRVGEAIDSGRRAWNQARERVLPMLSLTAGANLASKLIDIGRLEEADEVVSECVELERRVAGSAERLAMGKLGNWSIHDLRHQILLSRGDWRDAIASLERELTLQPDPHFRVALHWGIFVWLARCADGTRNLDVERHVAAGRQDSLAADCRRCGRELALKTAEAFARLGRMEDAEQELHVWDENGRPAHVNDVLWRRHVGALIALARRDPGGIAELEAVLAERRRLGLVGALLWNRLDLATALLGSDRRRAAEEFRQAGDEAAVVGAASEQQLAELALRRLGVRTWRRGRARGGESALDRLSQRERQIAGLISAGHSNPEIASRLFLSRKTVERHVSNILARMGARNRTELARLVSAQELSPTSR